MNTNIPQSQLLHIGIFGKRNAGKSEFFNKITQSDTSIVSHIPGTTADPVKKRVEVLPYGPAVFIDLPGADDFGELGSLRASKAFRTLKSLNAVILMFNGEKEPDEIDQEFVLKIKAEKIPFVAAVNKIDGKNNPEVKKKLKKYGVPEEDIFSVNAKTGEGTDRLLMYLMKKLCGKSDDKKLISDLIKPHSFVLLIAPQDESAPAKRLILPVSSVIREVIDSNSFALTVTEKALDACLEKFTPDFVVTDSSVLNTVSKKIPESIPLCTFSLLFARYKGSLQFNLDGAKALDGIKDGDRILICEGCAHRVSCNDIGREKLPKIINEYTQKAVEYEFAKGGDFPDDREIKKYKLVVHCGGCMLTEREVNYRIDVAKRAGVAFTNYGMIFSKANKTLQRTVSPFYQNNVDKAK